MKEKIGVDNIRFTLTGRNWINVNNIPGIDPETNQTGNTNGFGLDYFTNPQTKSTLWLYHLTFNISSYEKFI